MVDNWAEVRTQMDQMLELEGAQRRANRRQRPSLWQALRQWWPFSGTRKATAPANTSLAQHAHQ